MTIEAQDVQCTNCSLDLRPENALMIQGNPFCDRFCYQHYKINELVQQLAELRAELKAHEAAADNASRKIDDEIAEAKMVLEYLNTVREEIRHPHEFDIAETNNRIGAMQDCIIEAWDGKKKTLHGDGWALKFQTTKSLKINDPLYLLGDMLRHQTAWEIADKYISGYNKTAVKKYMSVHPQPPDVAELIEKTTVKLDVV